jgi:hypothetical protein
LRLGLQHKSGGVVAGRGHYLPVSSQSHKSLNIEDRHGMLFDIRDSLVS